MQPNTAPDNISMVASIDDGSDDDVSISSECPVVAAAPVCRAKKPIVDKEAWQYFAIFKLFMCYPFCVKKTNDRPIMWYGVLVLAIRYH